MKSLPHRPARAVLIAAVLLISSIASLPQTEAQAAHSVAASGCTKQVYVTFLVYSYMPSVTGKNNCWGFERPVQANWYILRTDGTHQGTSTSHWLYDDTNPQHSLATDRLRIKQAAQGHGTGYALMARRNGAWRKQTADPAHLVSKWYAELYTGEYAVDDLFAIWNSNRDIGRPMINVGRTSNARAYNATLRLCRAISSGSYMGIYSSQAVSPQNGKLPALVSALNYCTTH